MLSIGEFSILGKVTVKTLHHYDEIGLLLPFFTVPDTGYRYYQVSQLESLAQIYSLKQMRFSLGEIKEILSGEVELEAVLKARRETTLKELDLIKTQLTRLDNQIENLMNKNTHNNRPTVRFKSIPTVNVASMRRVIKNMDDLFTLCPHVMAKEMKRLNCQCAQPAYCFNLLHDIEFQEENIDVEICEAVVKTRTDSDILTFKLINEEKVVAALDHFGPYQSLGRSYRVLLEWIDAHGYRKSGLVREVFIDGIWNKEREEEWLTEIQMPVEKIV